MWSAEIKELEKLYESFKGQFPELEKELERLIKADDENMILLYSRRCLEVIITDLCECELKRPRKTEPLKGIIDKLHKEEKVPSNIITSMDHLNSLSAYGAHPKDFDPEQVKPVLVNLDIIIKWYLKYKESKINITVKSEEVKDEIQAPVDTYGQNQKQKKRLILLLSGLTLVVAIVVVALFVFNIIGGGNEIKELEKSIAVLPFKNDSPDQGRMYFINGTMEAILDNLCKIEDLRVVSRNSVEQYRDNPISTPVVAKEMNVSYVLEGSGHRDGNNVRLFIQLLEGKTDRHIWSRSYDADIEDIFSMQSEIAQLVATEIEAIITPQEKELIEKIPTSNLVAYEFYQKGLEEHWTYWLNKNNREALRNAERQYNYALDYDSTFSLAYTGLAKVYWDNNYWKEYFTEYFMDSAMSLVDKALSFDPQQSEAYILRGRYNFQIGDIDASIEAYNKALSLNPNNLLAYLGLSDVYFSRDMILEIDNLNKAVLLNREANERPSLIRSLGNAYSTAGFPDIWEQYMKEALNLDRDSVRYLTALVFGGSTTLSTEEQLKYARKAYELDSTNLSTLEYMGQIYYSLGNEEEALRIYNKLINRLEELEQLRVSEMHRVGYAFWLNGMQEEANYYFDLQIDYCLNAIKLNRPTATNKYAHYDLACIYAFRGENQKALEYLREYNQKKVETAWIARLIKNDPLLDNIRDEPEFQQIVRDVEAKYQAEHERVRKWLEENNML